MPITPGMIGAAAKGLQGLGQIAGGIIGGRRRRREQRQAKSEFNQTKRAYMGLDTSNAFTNMENTYEDLTVNTQAANFQAQEEAKGLSSSLNAMQGAAGGAGIAALMTAANEQQSRNLQAASANIGQQEAGNEMAKANMAGQLQTMERRGEMMSREMKREQAETMLGMAQQRLGAANEARNEATKSIIGGVGALAGAAADGASEFLR